MIFATMREISNLLHHLTINFKHLPVIGETPLEILARRHLLVPILNFCIHLLIRLICIQFDLKLSTRVNPGPDLVVEEAVKEGSYFRAHHRTLSIWDLKTH
jgi:hypothetical protein